MKIHDPDRVYKFILRFKERNDGLAPSTREIGQVCHIPSTSNVRDILTRLERMGKIELGPFSRDIRVVGARWVPPGQP